MNKIKTTGFWISLSGAVMLVVKTVLGAFNITFNSEIVSAVVSGLCSVLVIAGVLLPTKAESLKLDFEGVTEIENDLNNSQSQNEKSENTSAQQENTQKTEDNKTNLNSTENITE